MENFSLFSFIILAVLSLAQTGQSRGNSNSICGGIFEGDSGEFEFHQENSKADDSTGIGSSVCVWMIKLLKAGGDGTGAGISLKLEDLDENSVVNFYAEGEPTDPVNTPITLNSTQINSAVELSGKIFIITLKTQIDSQLENSPTKFVLSWSSAQQLSNQGSKSKVLPVDVTSANYFATGGEKGRYNFKTFHSHQKSVWILDAGADESGSLDAEVNVKFDSSCQPNLKSSRPKSLCECSYFGLFEILPSSGKLRLVNEFCGRSGSTILTEVSTQLVVFIYAMAPDSGLAESVEISWEENKDEPTTPEPPIKALTCPDNSTISPCICWTDSFIPRLDIWCTDPAVNQTTIETAFRETRRANDIPEGRGMDIFQFRLMETEMTQLDLAPLYGSRFQYLTIRSNSFLTKIVTSDLQQDHGSINVTYVFSLEDSPLNRDGIGDTLKYFSNYLRVFEAINLDLSLDENEDDDETGTGTGTELLSGLSAHTNLTTFRAPNCKISGRLSSDVWNFKGLQKLDAIVLDNNSITEVGESVFDLDVLGDLYIYLESNQLNETSFHPNSGIARPGRRTVLNLRSNLITTLPTQIFEIYMDAHPKNNLNLQSNPLICDERLSWVKSRKGEFLGRLENAYCSNDPGHSVFESELIP